MNWSVRGLLDREVDLAALEDGPFLQGEIVEGLVVFRQGADLGRTGGGQIPLETQDDEAGALAVLEFLLFGIQGGNCRVAEIPDLEKFTLPPPREVKP